MDLFECKADTTFPRDVVSSLCKLPTSEKDGENEKWLVVARTTVRDLPLDSTLCISHTAVIGMRVVKGHGVRFLDVRLGCPPDATAWVTLLAFEFKGKSAWAVNALFDTHRGDDDDDDDDEHIRSSGTPLTIGQIIRKCGKKICPYDFVHLGRFSGHRLVPETPSSWSSIETVDLELLEYRVVWKKKVDL